MSFILIILKRNDCRDKHLLCPYLLFLLWCSLIVSSSLAFLSRDVGNVVCVCVCVCVACTTPQLQRESVYLDTSSKLIVADERALHWQSTKHCRKIWCLRKHRLHIQLPPLASHYITLISMSACSDYTAYLKLHPLLPLARSSTHTN